MRDRENRQPQVDDEQAIDERARQYRDLKEAVAGILYTATSSSRRSTSGASRSRGCTTTCGARCAPAATAPRRPLIDRKQPLIDELERDERELATVRGEAERRRRNLVRFRDEIRA